MSSINLTADGQFRYICQWFTEWSELQREDFVPILVDCLKNNPSIYMNGVVNELSNYGCNDKPMSLFQCRIKLFKEWIPKWKEDMKEKLKEKVIELDEKIGQKLNEELLTVSSHTNGNGFVLPHELEPPEVLQQQQPIPELHAVDGPDNDENIGIENGHGNGGGGGGDVPDVIPDIVPNLVLPEDIPAVDEVVVLAAAAEPNANGNQENLP